MIVSKDCLIAIGKVIRPHGVRGAIRVRLHNPKSKLIPDKVEHMVIVSADGKHHGPLMFKHRIKSDVIFDCGDISNPETVTAIHGSPLMIPKREIPVESDEILFADLISCTAIDAETCSPFGTITNVSSHGASDVLTISTPEGLKLIPFVDEWIDRVDIQAKCVVINGPDLFPISNNER